MCNLSGFEFFYKNNNPEEFKEKTILEIGSKLVYCSVKPFVLKFLCPKKYIGIDIEPGKFVDIVLPAEKIVEYFGKESFDIIISTELLEHVKDWRKVIVNIKNVLKLGGILVLTTRSKGFPAHGYPHDFWRFEVEDIERIFEDFEIISLQQDPEAPGVFIKAMKPVKFNATDLSNIKIYSMRSNNRNNTILQNKQKNRNKLNLSLFKKLKHVLALYLKRIEKKIFSFLK